VDHVRRQERLMRLQLGEVRIDRLVELEGLGYEPT
jgi:hypothetical protein